MKKNFSGVYSAPQVRLCDVRIESGFVLSNPSDFNDLELDNRTDW